MLIEVAAAKQEGGQPLEPAAVATTLASFGAQGVPDLLAAIQSYPAIEPVLATALAQIGEPAFPSLLAGMKNDDELIRTAATRAIGSVRPLTPELIENLGAALQDASSTIRKLALEALINAGEPAESAEDKVLAACQDSDSEVRSIAIRGLSAFQYSPEQLSSAVSQSLADSAALVRANAVAVLRDLPEQLAAHVDDVVELAFDPVNDVRKSSMHALAGLKMDQIPDAVRIAVIDGLHDSDIAVRIAATEASNELNLDQVEVVDAIANNLQADTQLLQVSLNALAEVGGKAQSALPSIVNLLSHPSSTVRSSAIQAIVTIEQDQTLLAQQLQSSLEDSEWEVRKLAAVQLGKLGPTAVAAVPKLFTMLSSEDDSDFASSALREINSAPPEAVGLLMENLGSEDRRLGFYSVSLLGKIGPQAAEALPKLEEMLAKANEEGAGGRSEFRTRFLREAIAAIRNEKSE